MRRRESSPAAERPSVMRALRRPVRMIAGGLLLLTGAAVAPTPVPIGLILMLAGLTLLVAESVVLRDAVRAVRRRLPGLSWRLARMRDRVPGPLGRVIDLTDPCPTGQACRCVKPAE